MYLVQSLTNNVMKYLSSCGSYNRDLCENFCEGGSLASYLSENESLGSQLSDSSIGIGFRYDGVAWWSFEVGGRYEGGVG